MDGERDYRNKKRNKLEDGFMSVIEILNPHNLEAYQEINKLLESGLKNITMRKNLY